MTDGLEKSKVKKYKTDDCMTALKPNQSLDFDQDHMNGAMDSCAVHFFYFVLLSTYIS